MRWFTPWGPLFRPVSLIGWLISVTAAGLCVAVFVNIDAHSHSVSDTLIGISGYWVLTILVWYVIAWRTSAHPEQRD